MNFVAFIFARGGSKGLPNKNILKIGGVPMVAIAIKHALSVNRISRVIVSTDSDEIAKIAIDYGAEVPFRRPKELALDDSKEWLAWQHALNYLQEKEGGMPEAMVSVPVTAPLRIPLDIERCLDEYEKGGADFVITVTHADRSPYFNMVKKNPDGTVSLVIPDNLSVSRRQDSPSVFDMTTVAYVANSAFVMTNESLFNGRVKAVCIPKERAIDIDTEYDFAIAKYLFELNNVY